MNQQEFKVFEKIASNLSDINKSIKQLNDTIKKEFSNTNKSSVMYQIKDSLDDINETLESQFSKK